MNQTFVMSNRDVSPPSVPGGGAGTVTLTDLILNQYGNGTTVPYRTDGYYSSPWAQHDFAPTGIPTFFDFYNGAKPGVWANWSGGAYNAISPWGQITVGGSTIERYVRCQIRKPKMYFLNGTTWTDVTPSAVNSNTVPEGAYYKGDFSGAGGGIVCRSESTNGGGWSFPLSPIVTNPTYPMVHFWWHSWFPRNSLPSGTAAVHFYCEARIIEDTGVTNISNARFILGCASDVYTGGPTDSGGAANAGTGQARMKLLTPSWQPYGYTTLSQANMTSTPPPTVGNPLS